MERMPRALCVIAYCSVTLILLIFVACANEGPSSITTGGVQEPIETVQKTGKDDASQSVPRAVNSFVLVDPTTVRYRVREQLARLSFPNDAVGETNAVQGALVFDDDGMVDIESSRIVVTVSSLESDAFRRDRYLRNNSLETSKFPEVIFEPREIDGLDFPLDFTQPRTFTMTGLLTVRDISETVTWDVETVRSEGLITGNAFVEFTFDYFSISKPKVFVVLSVDDTIRLEMDFTARSDS